MERIGSSPRAWGTPSIRLAASLRRRIIPTCVGNTEHPTPRRNSGADHPHVRGEHRPRQRRKFRYDGSSPRAWGTHLRGRNSHIKLRIIPTCVGNTIPSRVGVTRESDHPHVRGEHPRGWLSKSTLIGSSPRAWGTRLRNGGEADEVRIIPTCVGNTAACRRRPLPRADHPHVRGEHSRSPCWPRFAPGSSPRAWGTPLEHGRDARRPRIIPTCVGNTSPGRSRDSPRPDHPHVRGEHRYGNVSP